MEEIKGYVEHIVYRNEDNGYTVFHLNNSDGEVTCVGNFHFIEEGELLKESEPRWREKLSRNLKKILFGS